MIQTASGAQRPACAQFSGRKHVEKLSGNWIPGAFMSAKIYREHKKEVRAQRKAMRAEAKIANASPFIGPIANPENMRRQAFMRAAAKNPF